MRRNWQSHGEGVAREGEEQARKVERRKVFSGKKEKLTMSKVASSLNKMETEKNYREILQLAAH